MYELSLYPAMLTVLGANPSVEIVETMSKRIEMPGDRAYYASSITIRYEGDVRDLVAPLDQHHNRIPQIAEHRCTIQRYSDGSNKEILLEDLVVRKIVTQKRLEDAVAQKTA